MMILPHLFLLVLAIAGSIMAGRRKFQGLLAESLKTPAIVSILSDKNPLAEEQIVGRVSRLFVYPIKSCRGHEYGPEASLDILTKGFKYDRRWVIVASKEEKEGSKFEKLSLREDPRLTLINTFIDEEKDVLRIWASERALVPNLGPLEISLYPTVEDFTSRDKVKVEMWGDHSSGRAIGKMPPKSVSPVADEWLQKFLDTSGPKVKKWHNVRLVQYDPADGRTRKEYEPWKLTSDVAQMREVDKKQYLDNRALEFQDEYQFHITTTKSYELLNEVMDLFLKDPEKDKAHVIDEKERRNWLGNFSRNEEDDWSIKMERFRPNIVIEGNHYPFAEDSWDMLWLSKEGELQHDKFHARLAVISRCKRCALTHVDPITARVSMAVIRLIGLLHYRTKKKANPTAPGAEGPCFGMMFRPLRFFSSKEGKLTLQKEQKVQHKFGKLKIAKRGGDGMLQTLSSRQAPTFDQVSPLPKVELYEKLGVISIGDVVKARWRPMSDDDEPYRFNQPSETLDQLLERVLRERDRRRGKQSLMLRFERNLLELSFAGIVST